MTSGDLVAVFGRTAVGGATTADADADAAALEAIIVSEYARLVRLAGAICREPADAEDAVAGAIERALRHRAALRDPTSTVPWLNQIVVREAIRLDGRRRTWWDRLRSGPREIELPSDADDPGTSGALVKGALHDALDELPVPQRAALALHHYAGYSVQETAAILGVPLETARSRLRLARERVRRALREERP